MLRFQFLFFFTFVKISYVKFRNLKLRKSGSFHILLLLRSVSLEYYLPTYVYVYRVLFRFYKLKLYMRIPCVTCVLHVPTVSVSDLLP